MTKPTVRPIDALTSIRGLAAWWVVFYHFREALPPNLPGALDALFSRGYLAVDLFFQLSGFVIALNYASSFRSVTFAGTLRFLSLRLARIYPLHLFMMVLFLVNPLAIKLFSAHGGTAGRYDPGYFLMSLFLVQNWGFAPVAQWNIPAWSISTEWFAYLLFPVLAWACCRFLHRAFSIVLLAALLFAALAVAASRTDSIGNDFEHFGLIRCVVQFGIGMLIFRLYACRPLTRRFEGDVLALLALACFAVFAVLPVPDYAVMPLGFFLLIYALTDDRGTLSRILRGPVLEWLGLVSYSTYIVHYFIKDWVKFLLLRPGVPDYVPVLAYVATVLAASALLYRCVEVPGRVAMRAVFASGVPWHRIGAALRRPGTVLPDRAKERASLVPGHGDRA